MTESLITFFQTMPVNHWSSFVVVTIALIFIAYTVYFFFSKEGKDERGKHIYFHSLFCIFCCYCNFNFRLW